MGLYTLVTYFDYYESNLKARHLVQFANALVDQGRPIDLIYRAYYPYG